MTPSIRLALAGFFLLAPLYAAPPGYDPLAYARDRGDALTNHDAEVPPQCYTKTGSAANPCWTCHTARNGRNEMDDADLQHRYAFSPEGQIAHWTNLFVDRRAATAAISDQAILGYIRTDNYTVLRQALASRQDYPGWRPDLDAAGDFDDAFDANGYARDGSGWRAYRYLPFPGSFWPTNGNVDEAMIRLPATFRSDAIGRPSMAIYAANLAIVEAAVSTPEGHADDALHRTIEPIDEAAVGADLDGDGRIDGEVRVLNRLPAHYLGAAANVPVQRDSYPLGTEFMHPVRYLDPDRPDLLAPRMKELRYAVKRIPHDAHAEHIAYETARAERDVGSRSSYPGSPERGYVNEFGWQLQGFIENAAGQLRLQTAEEQRSCMGCHGGIGVTVDQTFSFPRKLPGAPGWARQTLVGLQDIPEAGQTDPEILTWLRRVGGGDEFRSNTEILRRFFPNGGLDEAAVRRAAAGGDLDVRALIAPSRVRALQLDKASLVGVRSQHFEAGRDVLLAPPENLLRRVETESTGLTAAHRYADGRLRLAWPEPAAGTNTATTADRVGGSGSSSKHAHAP
jgi:hypothetical protein